jgi:UDP-N-acetylenolpyruvoylglucosamine reductase
LIVHEVQRGIALGEARVAAADVVVVINDGHARWDDVRRKAARQSCAP